MKAVIMAGGFGTRIQPLTINLPKPMIPLINRPIMLHIVELLKKHGIDELVLLLYHQPETIKNFFGDGSEYGVHISYVTPLEDFGTAGAVKAAAKFLDERFMVISGDLLTDFDLSAVMAFHQQKQARATITLTSVSDPLQFGVVITDKRGRISKFLEKPGWGEVFSDTINTGIYILEPEVLAMIPEGENRDWSKDVFPAMLAADEALFGCVMTGYWADIGNTDAYLEACSDIAAGRVSVGIREVQTDPNRRFFLGAEATVNPDNLNGLVVVGENSRVHTGAKLKNSILGRNCIVEEGATLEDAVLWDNVYVKKGARINGAVLCHNVRVGRLAVIESGVVVGDETTVGNEAFLKRDVKVWPRKVIEGGATVTTNLIWGEKWRKSLFDGALVKGLTNIELTPEFTAKLGAAYGSTLPKDAFILAGRDAIRSSRMLKRSFVGGLLSAGINVRDVKMIPLPVLRYKLTTFGEVGGVHFRQSPEDPAATEIVFFDADGIEFSSAMAKNTERIFFKENFRRVHHSEPGGISELPRIYDYYQEGYLRALDRNLLTRAKPKLVVDLNHSPAGDLLPPLLAELGCEVIELNSHVEESKVGTTPEQLEKTMEQLSRIVVTLEADAGFWIGPSGEKLTIIDDTGDVLSNLEALAVLAALTCQAEAEGSLAVPVSAPQVVEDLAEQHGKTVLRTKNDGRALVEAARNPKVRLAASMDGRFSFPVFQPNFDALFSIAKILELLSRTGTRLSQMRLATRQRQYRRSEVPCSFEFKGGIMRKMSEDSIEQDTSFIDGVKVTFADAWVLVLPDQSRPVAHVIVEAADAQRADTLIEHYRVKVATWIEELRKS
jgi:mannose-1-phosphate guanylyltransferase/phosphomannomutase